MAENKWGTWSSNILTLLIEVIFFRHLELVGAHLGNIQELSCDVWKLFFLLQTYVAKKTQMIG